MVPERTPQAEEGLADRAKAGGGSLGAVGGVMIGPERIGPSKSSPAAVVELTSEQFL